MNNNEIEDRLLTVGEAARYLGYQPGTIYNKVSARTVPHIRLGRSLRFRKSELDRWVSERDAESRSGEDAAA